MLAPLLLRLLPVLFFLSLCFYIGRKKNIHPIPLPIVYFFVIILVLTLAAYPEELNYDKPRYTMSYLSAVNSSFITDYKDMGWPYYLFVCSRMFGSNIDLFYIFTAAIYLGGYCVFAWRFFPHNIMGYFIVFAAGCLGFTNYGVNTIRAGIALSLLLISLVFFDLKSLKWKLFSIIIAFAAIMFHKSMVIPLTAFFISIIAKNMKIVIAFWGACFLLSAVNFDLSELFEYVGFVDERIGSYIENADELSNYKSGFRIDFIIYSLIPMFFSWYYIKMKRVNDALFLHLIRMYLFSNAVWLLAIRVHYSDRLAYLSWFLIPALMLLPVCNSQKSYKSPQNMVLLAMLVFMFLPVFFFLQKI